MSRRNQCSTRHCPTRHCSTTHGSGSIIRSSIRGGTFAVLDHEDAIEVLIRSDIIAERPFRLNGGRNRCLTAILLDVQLDCRAVLAVGDFPAEIDDEVVASLSNLLAELPGHLSSVVLVICSATDPSDDRSHTSDGLPEEVWRLASLCGPLDAVGIELRDVIECFPSGWTSLRSDLILEQLDVDEVS
jgi:hypothetical protein